MTTDAIVPATTEALSEVPLLHVLFVVAGAEYALPASIVFQMEAFTGATAVPGTAAFVAGVVQLRGRVVPVVDLRVRFGFPAQAAGTEARLVVGEIGGRTVALVADRAREVINLTPSQIKPPPRLLEDGASGFVRGIVSLDARSSGARTILVLDFAKVIGEESIDV